MKMENTKKPSDQKRIRRQLYKLTDQEDLSLDFVFALAGERELTSNETKTYQKLSKDRGELLYVDLKAPTVISESKISKIAEIAIKDGLTQLFDVSTFDHSHNI
jgi:hypothetical protein